MSKKDARRAYLVDGDHGTRSGPIRNARARKLLREDLRILREHALSDSSVAEQNSGIAAPGDRYWTDLDADSAVEKHWEMERERIEKRAEEARKAAREEQGRRERKRERKARERRRKEIQSSIRDMERDVRSRSRDRLDRDTQRDEARRTA
jgi:hypothetical protein